MTCPSAAGKKSIVDRVAANPSKQISAEHWCSRGWKLSCIKFWFTGKSQMWAGWFHAELGSFLVFTLLDFGAFRQFWHVCHIWHFHNFHYPYSLPLSVRIKATFFIFTRPNAIISQQSLYITTASSSQPGEIHTTHKPKSRVGSEFFCLMLFK